MTETNDVQLDWLKDATMSITFTRGDQTLTISGDDFDMQWVTDEDEGEGNGHPHEQEEPVSTKEWWKHAITLYGQRDIRWAMHRYHGSYTIGGAGCYIVSFCMLLDWYYGDQIATRPDIVSSVLNTHNVFYNGLFTGVVEAANQYGLKWHGRHNWDDKLLTANDLKTVKDTLEDGPVIMAVDFYPRTAQWETHFVLALQYNEVKDDILIADPWEGELAWLMDSRYSLGDDWDLARAIYGLRIFRKEEESD